MSEQEEFGSVDPYRIAAVLLYTRGISESKRYAAEQKIKAAQHCNFCNLDFWQGVEKAIVELHASRLLPDSLH